MTMRAYKSVFEFSWQSLSFTTSYGQPSTEWSSQRLRLCGGSRRRKMSRTPRPRVGSVSVA